MPQLFVLTKREQRVAVAIAILLLLGAVAKHYHFVRTHLVLPPTSNQPTASPIPPPPGESEVSDDAR